MKRKINTIDMSFSNKYTSERVRQFQSYGEILNRLLQNIQKIAFKEEKRKKNHTAIIDLRSFWNFICLIRDFKIYFYLIYVQYQKIFLKRIFCNGNFFAIAIEKKCTVNSLNIIRLNNFDNKLVFCVCLFMYFFFALE